MRLTDFLTKATRLYPDRAFLRFYDRVFRYGECSDRVNRLAHALRSRFAVCKEDRVAVLSRNHPAVVETYLACGKIGAVAVPLNYRLHPSDYVYILNDAGVRVLVLGREFAQVYRAMASDLNHTEGVLIIGDACEGPGYEDVIRDSSPEDLQACISDEDVLVQIYTGGSSGLPQGVLLTHRNLVSTALGLVIDVRFNVDPCDILVVAPIFHIGALITVFCAMVTGASCNLKREFSPPEVLEGMSEEGSTHSFLVPVMISALLDTPKVKEYDYSGFKVLMYGAAPMSGPLLKRALEVFGCEFIQGYGLTESTGVLGLLLPEDHRIRPGATCREYRMAELRVVNPDGERVNPGEVGEIIARGPGVMRGYWGMEEETRAAFINGWLRTGDLATVDAQGYITVVDRRKDMIITGGENIYPGEIERVLLTHPAIQQAAAIGVPDEKWGEAVKALVVLKPGQSLVEKDLMQFCRQNLAHFKRPRSVEFREQLPLSPTGKVLKKVLREEFWTGYAKRVH